MTKHQTPLSVLIKRIAHKDPEVRAATLYALSDRGQWADVAAPALADSFRNNRSSAEQNHILRTLVAVAPKATITWDILRSVSNHGNRSQKEIVLDFIEKDRPPTEQAALLIRIMIDQPDDSNFDQIIKLARRYFPIQEITTKLSEHFQKGDLPTRSSLLSAVSILGRQAWGLVPDLIMALYELPPREASKRKGFFFISLDPTDWYRDTLIELLLDIGPVPDEIAPALLKALTTPNGTFHLFDTSVIDHYWANSESWFSHLHFYYAQALVAHPQTCNDIFDYLLQSLHHPNYHVRRYAAELLGAYGQDGKKAVEGLIHALLEDKYYRVRYYAAQSLQKIGEYCTEARQAIPALKRALQDPDYSVRKYSQEALKFLEIR